MMSTLIAAPNIPFAVALGLMLAIALLEGIGSMLGSSISGFLEGIVPESDLDLDLDGADSHPAALSQLFGWLRLGQVPVLMLLIIFLTGFGLIGLVMQGIIHATLGYYLPAPVAVVPAFLLALPVVRLFGGALATIIPKDETEAVAESSFVGRVATITLGTASANNPAEARLKDQFGQDHYVMLEPDQADERFESGTVVLLVRQEGVRFYAIRNPSHALID